MNEPNLAKSRRECTLPFQGGLHIVKADEREASPVVARRSGGPLHDLEADAALGVGGHVGRARGSPRGARFGVVPSFCVGVGLLLGKVDLAAAADPAAFRRRRPSGTRSSKVTFFVLLRIFLW